MAVGSHQRWSDLIAQLIGFIAQLVDFIAQKLANIRPINSNNTPAVGTHQDWSALCPDLLNLIAKKLPDVLDFVRFRATCKSWLSSAPLSDSPRQCPWLVEHNMYSHTSQPTTRLYFYSVSSRQKLTVPIKEIKRFETLTVPIEGIQGFDDAQAPSHHYLPITNRDERTISFFNPLTKDKYVLPPIPGTDILGGTWVIQTGISSIHDRSVAAVACTYPSDDVIQCKWALYSPQNGQWTQEDDLCTGVTNCYCQGMLFSSNIGGRTTVFDMSARKVIYRRIPRPEVPYCISVNTNKGRDVAHLRRSHLIESSGKVLRVSSFSNQAEPNSKHYVFLIHKLDFSVVSRQPHWVRVNDIGNQTILLSHDKGFSIPAQPAAGFKQNCIYFIDCDNGKTYVHDIAALTVEMLPCPLKWCTWFVPGLC